MKILAQRFALILLSSSSLISTPVLANDLTSSSNIANPPEESQQSESQSDNAAEEGAIIVTAQKRSESVQRVPIAISVATGDQLIASGVNSTRELNLIAPGLNYTFSSNGAQIVLRGLASLNSTPGQESLVSVFVDGVYQPSQTGLLFDLPNIERIEVLKGPQGTLYGRNAAAGAISIITKDPSQSVEGNVRVGYGRYSSRRIDAYVSAPLASNFGMNVSAQYSGDNGYIKDTFAGVNAGLRRDRKGASESWSVRAKLLWTPTPDLTMRVIGYRNQLDTTANVAWRPITPISNALLTDPNVVFAPDYAYNGNIDGYSKSESAGASVEVVWDFPAFTATSITSYGQVQADSLTDSDAGPNNVAWNRLRFLEKTFIEEFHLVSNTDGPLSWLAGFNYFHNVSRYNPLVLNLGTIIRTPTVSAQAPSIFGELTYKLTDQLSISGALRYTSERRTLRQVVQGVFLARAERRFNKVTPRVTLQYQIDPKTQLYATYSQGFKSGLYNASNVVLPLTPVFPAEIVAYEAGLKTQPAPGLRVNLSAFYYDISNLQETARLPNTTTALVNAARAESYGGELEINYRASPQLRLNGGIAYSHARYTDYPGAIYYVPRADGRGYQLVTDNAAGRPLLRAPDWSINASGTYEIPTSFGSVSLNAAYSFQSNFYWDTGKQLAQGETHLLNGRITVANASEDLQFSLVGKNLLDRRRYAFKFNTNLVNYGIQQQPLWYGVELSYRFK